MNLTSATLPTNVWCVLFGLVNGRTDPASVPPETFVFPLLSVARHWRWWLDRRLKP